MDLVGAILLCLTVIGLVTLFTYIRGSRVKSTTIINNGTTNSNNNNASNSKQLPHSTTANMSNHNKKKNRKSTNGVTTNSTATKDTDIVMSNVDVKENDGSSEELEALPLDSHSVFVKRLSNAANGSTKSGNSQMKQNEKSRDNKRNKSIANHIKASSHESSNIYTPNQLFEAIRESTLTREENETAVELLLNRISGADEWRQQRNDPLQNLKRQLKEKEQLLANQIANNQLTKKQLVDAQSEVEKVSQIRDTLRNQLTVQQSISGKIKDDADTVIRRLELERSQLTHSNDDLNRLQLQLSERNKTIREYEETVAKCRSVTHDLEQKLLMCEVQIKTISSARQRDDFNARTQLAEMSKKLTEVENDKMQTDAKAQEILQKFTDSLNHMHSLEQRYEERGQLVHNLECQMKELLKRRDESTHEIDKLRLELVERQKLNERRKAELAEEGRRLKLMLSDKDDMISQLTVKLNDTQNQMRQTLNNVSEQYETEKELKAKLICRVTELEKERDKVKFDTHEALGEMQSELQQLQDKLTVKSTTYEERLKQEVLQIESKLANASNRERQLLDQLRRAFGSMIHVPETIDTSEENWSSVFIEAIEKLSKNRLTDTGGETVSSEADSCPTAMAN